VLGVAKFGTRRKLHQRLLALRSGGSDSGEGPSAQSELLRAGGAASPGADAGAGPAAPAARASAAEKGKGAAVAGAVAAPKPRGDKGAFEAALDPRLGRAAKLVDAQLDAEASAVGTLKVRLALSQTSLPCASFRGPFLT